MKVEFSDGGWAVLRDVDTLNGGDKLAVLRATRWPIPSEQNPEPTVSAATAEEPKLALLTRLITEWSFPGWPIPADALDGTRALEQLPINALDALLSATEPYMDAINNPSS